MSRRPVGRDGARCGAKTRSGGNCTQVAGWGTDHVGEGPCKLHGGSTPTVRKGAQLRLVEREARELFGRIAPEIVPVDNPLAAYAGFAGRVMAWMNLMDELLDELRSVGYRSEAGEQTAAAVQLYERAMDRTNTVLASYARLNIDTRLAAITEQQAKTVMRAIEAVITLLGASSEQATEARAVAARHLRAAG
jgi:hypothetical protein